MLLLLAGISISVDSLCFIIVLICSVLQCAQKGQLGHGDKVQRDRPTIVSELSQFVSLPTYFNEN